MPSLKIGELAQRTATSVATIRFYESISLLPEAARGVGRQRVYEDEDVQRLLFIRRCRDFGFTIEQVRTLSEISRDRTRSCDEVRDVAHTHLAAVRAKLMELKALEHTLVEFAKGCTDECLGGPGPSCVPLVKLAGSPMS